ncbi:MAG: ABC transporter permease, partial [Oscillospiraceae bacterium]|nr:ABC transporter permease [Oscillospiraceae bacterium]
VISSIESVELVQAPYDFAEALVDIRNTLSVILAAVLATLVTISVIIVSNTIRTSVFARRNEITIMKYVGATNGFIKTPFFVEGMFIGILAGAAAWGLTWSIYSSIYALFDSNLTVWRMFGMYDLIPFDSINWIVLVVNCAAGALLGAVGTTISTGKYLKV